jgi:uncharacterized protein YjiS (DUF1127 family)
MSLDLERFFSPLEPYVEPCREHEQRGIFRRALRHVASGCRRLIDRITTELSARRHVQFLSALDDRMLSDIGVARHDIPTLVRSSIERRQRSHSGRA